jgi:hypothetical protein
MAKNKVSEWSATPANNTDIANIDIAEGCAPSGINNAIREIMAQVKDMQTGADGDGFAVSGTLAITGGLTLDGASGTSGQVMLSGGSGNTPTWGNAFVAGMIMLWSGSVASVPTGWLLCDGTNSTPDLRNRFVIGAATDSGGAPSTTVTGSATQAGGSKDAIVVSHTHSATVTDPGHAHDLPLTPPYPGTGGSSGAGLVPQGSGLTSSSATTGISVTNSTTGSSGTNANLPPYYALAYIMKS